MEQVKEQIKELLNNLTLLRFVKKFSADKLQEDNKFAERFNIKSSEKSINILDTTSSKLLCTNSEFVGEEHSKYSVRQLAELLDTIGSKEGEIIIPKDNKLGEMIVRVNKDILVVCGLPKSDTKQK